MRLRLVKASDRRDSDRWSIQSRPHSIPRERFPGESEREGEDKEGGRKGGREREIERKRREGEKEGG